MGVESQLDELRLFYTRVTLSWGFIVRFPGVSASQPAYILPPQPTIVGAFAAPLLRLLGMSDSIEVQKHGNGRVLNRWMKILLESTVVVSCGIPPAVSKSGLAVYQEMSRIIAFPYKTGGQRRETLEKPLNEAITDMMPVQAAGASYGAGTVLDLLWIVNASLMAKNLGIRIEDIDSIGSLAVRGVTRVGSKESIVSVDPRRALYTDRVKILMPGEYFRSYMFLPAECVEPIDPVPDLMLLDRRYALTKFYVPAYIASDSIIVGLIGILPRFKLIEPCKAFTCEGCLEGAVGVGQ